MKIRDATEHDIDGIIAIDHIAASEETRRQHIREWVRRGCTIIVLARQDQIIECQFQHRNSMKITVAENFRDPICFNK